MPKLYLTDSFVYSVLCPEGKDQDLFWDHPKTVDGITRRGAVPGLGLRVTKQGNKTFVHSYRANGKRRRIAIGSPPTMNVASARLAVTQRELELKNDGSIDADVPVKQAKHPHTMRQLIDEYWEAKMQGNCASHRMHFANFIAPWLRAPTKYQNRGENRRRSYTAFGKDFGDYKPEDIKPREIEAFLQQHEAASTYNTVLKLIRAVFNWAIRMQIVDMRNPCDPLDKRKIIKQRRDYTEEHISKITKHIFQPPQAVVPVIRGTGLDKQKAALAAGRIQQSNQQMEEFCAFAGILFLTMARPVELMRAEFSHFDLQRLIWHKHHTKGIKLSNAVYEYAYRSVPIHPKVAELVQQQRQRWPSSSLVFPSPKDATQPRDNFKRQIDQFRKLDGVPKHFQLYDLKRIAISLMLVGQGVRREDVSHYVDHKGDLATTMIYDLGFVDPLRPVTERLGQLLGV